MKVEELISLLENTPSRSKRALLDEAAETIRNMAQSVDVLGETLDAAKADMKLMIERWSECDICKHLRDESDAECVKADFNCADCGAECECRRCHGSSQWDWRGVKKGGD